MQTSQTPTLHTLSAHPYAMIPGGGYAYCGPGAPATDQDFDGLPLAQALVPHPDRTDWLIARGESMQGFGIEDGHIVYVERSIFPRNGWVIFCCYESEPMIKRYVEINGASFLESDYGEGRELTPIHGQFRFLGRVISHQAPAVRV